MRLEKIAYEKIFNNKLLGRARNITKPSRICNDAEVLLTMGPTFGLSTLLAPLGRWLMKHEWKFFSQGCEQRGLALEDFVLFRSEELRRDPLYEHMFRESMHPLQFEMARWRRLRYFKVDDCIKGFEAPDYLKEEARKRTYIQSLANITKFRHFFEHNYANEITPQTYMYKGSVVVLELFMIYGITSRNAWTRYFFNEIHHYTSGTYVEERRNGKKPLDFANDADWEVYKKTAVTFNKDFPGYLAPRGESVDFVKLRETLEATRVELGFDTLTDEDLNDIARRFKMSQYAFVQPSYEGEEAKGKSNIGVDQPAYLKKSSFGGFFN